MGREFGKLMFAVGLTLLLLAAAAPLLGMDPAENVVDTLGAGISVILILLGGLQMRRK